MSAPPLPPRPSARGPSAPAAAPPLPPRRSSSGGFKHCLADPTDYAIDFYIAEQAPDFLICQYCFNKFIRGSQHEHHFQKKNIPEKGQCMLSLPRTKQVWQEVQRTGDFGIYVVYAVYRLSIDHCPGATRMTSAGDGSNSTAWYRSIRDESNSLLDLTICKACYEDHAVPATFSNRFSQVQQPQHPICDICLPQIKTALKECSEKGYEWDWFVKTVSQRKRLGISCQGEIMPSSTAYCPKDPRLSNVTLCELCWRDNVSLSPEADKWKKSMVSGNSQPCQFRDGSQFKGAWVGLALHDQLPRFYDTSIDILSSRCGANTAEFSLKGGNFNLCPGCYAAYMKVYGWEDQFVRTRQKTSCDLDITSPKIASYISALSKSIDTGDTSYIRTKSIDMGNIVECKGQEPNNETKWYGNDSFDMCQWCYETFFKGSKFDSPRWLTYRDATRTDQCCDMWSQRLRSKYKEACDADNLGLFEQFCIQRAHMLNSLRVQMDQVLQVARMQQQQQAMNGTMNSFYLNMDGIAGARIDYAGTGHYEYLTNSGLRFNTPYATTALGYGQAAAIDTSNLQATIASGQQLAALYEQWE